MYNRVGDTMRLLIIEDNIPLAKEMKIKFERDDYAVDLAFTGADGEVKATSNEYDIILLDLNLPDKSGFDVLSYLKKEDVSSSLLIVSARGQTQEIIHGLQLGADDYITKPYDFSVLTARIQAVQRRRFNIQSTDLQFGELNINLNLKTIQINQKEIELSAKEYSIIEYLALASPRIVSSEELIEHLYDEDFNPFSSVLRVHIANLKKKINKNNTEYLQNIKGKGYRL